MGPHWSPQPPSQPVAPPTPPTSQVMTPTVAVLGAHWDQTSVGSQCGQGGARDEGTQAAFVSGQDPDGFQTGELTAGLDVPGEDPEDQLTQVL